jgi:hypothetical protein
VKSTPSVDVEGGTALVAIGRLGCVCVYQNHTMRDALMDACEVTLWSDRTRGACVGRWRRMSERAPVLGSEGAARPDRIRANAVGGRVRFASRVRGRETVCVCVRACVCA